MLYYQITESDHCRSLDSFLRNLLPTGSPAYLKKLVSSGNLTLNGSSVLSSKVLLLDGDRLTIKESAKTASLVRTGQTGPDILHEDQWIIVFNKAPGLAMHMTAEEEEDLVQLGTGYLAGRDGFPGKLRPVNRLDRGTSGVVVLAKSSTAAGIFGRLIMGSGFSKVYLAIVQGRIPREGRINLPLEGKDAETVFRSLFQSEAMAVAAVYPVSGRMHQIRKHFKSIGHPVYGDRRYGGVKLEEGDGIFLHSFRTSFKHPVTGEMMTLVAPLPKEFLAMLRVLAGEFYPVLLRTFPDIPVEAP